MGEIPLSDIEVSSQDILDSRWKEVIAGKGPGRIDSYSHALFVAARKSRNPSRRKALFLLGCVCQMFYCGGNSAEPLKPLFRIGSKCSTTVDSFTESQLGALATALPGIDDEELSARVGDLLWLRKKDHRAARTAVNAYMAAAKRFWDPDHWTHGFNRIQRAMRIAASLGRKNPERAAVASFIQEQIKDLDGTDPLLLTNRLIDLLLEHGDGDLKALASQAHKAAEVASERSDFMRAAENFELQARCLRKAGDARGTRAAKVRQAEAYASIGEAMFATGNPQLAATHWIEQAIHTLSAAGDNKKRKDALIKRLREMQNQAKDQMQYFTTSVEVPQSLIDYVQRAKGLEFLQALAFMGGQARPMKMVDLRKLVLERHETDPLSDLFGTHMIAEDGRVEFAIPPLPREGPIDEEILQLHMWHIASQSRNMWGWAIEHIRQIILDEHPAETWNLEPLLIGNLFVPSGREIIYDRALRAGLQGDFLVAVHLICPQLENSFRYIFGQRDGPTTYVKPDGSQDEYLMSDLVRRPEFADIFGEDLAFDLRGLLVERAGSNVRNDTSHGFKSAESFNSYESLYLLAITIFLLVHGMQRPEDSESEEQDAD